MVRSRPNSRGRSATWPCAAWAPLIRRPDPRPRIGRPHRGLNVLAFARAAKASGARRFVMLSCQSANPKSRRTAERVQGETLEALTALGFESLDIMLPGTLLGLRRGLKLSHLVAMSGAAALRPCSLVPASAGAPSVPPRLQRPLSAPYARAGAGSTATNSQGSAHFPESAAERDAVNIERFDGVTDSGIRSRHAGVYAPAVALFPNDVMRMCPEGCIAQHLKAQW